MTPAPIYPHPRRALFLQVTEPGAYPPIINAAALFGQAGWQVTLLSAPTSFLHLRVPSLPNVCLQTVRTRSAQAVDGFTYLQYLLHAVRLARSLKPQLVYAFDQVAAGPAIAASCVSGARMIYHELDTPEPGTRGWLARLRARCARSAHTVIFPNRERADFAVKALGLKAERVRVVWNVPRLAELPKLDRQPSEGPLVLYYHGNISPVLLPESVPIALGRLGGRAVLRVVGYENPSAQGYLSRLREIDGDRNFIQYGGQISREALLLNAADADVGLALSPKEPTNINERYLVGASNKVFDYMAAGLAVLVGNDGPSAKCFAVPGFAQACDSTDPDSVVSTLGRLIENPEARRQMGQRARAKIETHWNFERAYTDVFKRIND